MNKNPSKEKRIAVISNAVNNFSLSKFIKNNNYDKFILESENQYIENKFNKEDFIKFIWNEKDTITKLRVESLAFDLTNQKKQNESIKKLKFLLGNTANYKLVYRVTKRITIDSYVEILKSFAIAGLYLNEGKVVTLVFKKSFKENVQKVFEYIKKEQTSKKYDWSGINKVSIKYIGFSSLTFIHDYFKTAGIGIYLMSTIRKFRINKKKHYKVGLLTWTNSKTIGNSNFNNEGLDAVIPKNIMPNEVLIYGKNQISNKNLELIKSRGYHSIKFDLENIYRESSLKDLIILVNLFLRIIVIYPILSFRIHEPIRHRLPYIIYQYLKWNKFISYYKLELSIGYLEYSLGDLIRNCVLINNGTSCYRCMEIICPFHEKIFYTS